jgi:hypothetical protein
MVAADFGLDQAAELRAVREACPGAAVRALKRLLI